MIWVLDFEVRDFWVFLFRWRFEGVVVEISDWEERERERRRENRGGADVFYDRPNSIGVE